jgi:hypothetical protein
MSSPSCRQINRAAVEVAAKQAWGRGSRNALRCKDARSPDLSCEPRHSAARRQSLIPESGRSRPDREEA